VVVVVALLAAAGAVAVLAARRGPRSNEKTAAAPSTTGPAAVTPLPVGSGVPTTAGGDADGPLGAVRGRTVAVDPGHNGRNASHPEINRLVDIGTGSKACDAVGAETRDGYSEAAFTLDVSLRLADLLRRAGAQVVLTRQDNDGWGPCITERAAIGNRAGADVAVSVHADGGPPTGRGFHVIYPPPIAGLTDGIAADSKRLAYDVRAAYREETGRPYADYTGTDGLSERRDLGGLNLSKVPKVFIETGNMRNDGEAALLEDPAFRQRAAMAIADGLAAFLAGR
jgi:N-acetylmuramoyl-L-alanine amidase